MKKAVLIIFAAVISTVLSCDSGLFNKGADHKHEHVRQAGETLTFSANGIDFAMKFVPAKRSWININDSGSVLVDASYWIADTELPYELWAAVYEWATTNAGEGKRADGGELYSFKNPGWKGNDNAVEKSARNPVTSIDWCDAIVWCNAATEWYNAQHQTSYSCVYTYAGLVVRDSNFPEMCDSAVVVDSADGFRLLTSREWELAARYIEDLNSDGDIMDENEYYPGDHVSGDTTGYCEPTDSGTSGIFGDYAWYRLNSGDTTHEGGVGIRPNALGLYDMSGNVWEWCFDWATGGTQRIVRGGSYNENAGNLQIGFMWSHLPWNDEPPYAYIDTGMRLAMSDISE